MTLLMQRLRTLQLRLNSVDSVVIQEAGERVLEWRRFLEETKARENRRRQLYAYVTESTQETTTAFANCFDSQFLPRLSESFDKLKPAIESRAAAIGIEDEFDGRLSALERRNAEADAQLVELRAACSGAYEKLSEVNDRLDRIWADQSTEGFGSWRVVVRKTREEKEVSTRTPLQSFRDNSFYDDSDPDEAERIGMICPQCWEPSGRRKRRAGLKDDLLGLLGIAPFGCPRCMVRFYRLQPVRRRRPSV